MNQEGNLAANIWEVPSSPLAPTVSASSAAGNNDIIEESITLSAIHPRSETTRDITATTVSSLSLPSALIIPITPQYNTSESDSVDTFVASPASSCSSLSEPPTEPNSPTLFYINGLKIKNEPTEDTTEDIAGEVVNHVPPTFPTTANTIPSVREARARGGDRRIDPCADPEFVEVLRVAHAANQTEGLKDDLTTTHTRNLRRTSERINRTNMSPTIERSSSSLPHNRTPVGSKKRGRNSLGNQQYNTNSYDGLAIKKEMLEEHDEATIGGFVPTVTSTKKRIGRPPGKKQRVNSAPELSQVSHGSHTDQKGEDTTIIATNDITFSKKEKKKFPRKPTYIYVTEELGQNGPEEETRGSVPPSFTFRYALPHTPFELNKEPLRSSRYWSEGAKDTGNLKPIGGTFQRKDGLLTDVVCITESRLRPRKSSGQLPLKSPGLQKPEKPRKGLNPGKEPKQSPKVNSQLGKATEESILALAEEYDETEESGDDNITVTEYEYHEDDSSDTFNKSDEGDEVLEGIDDDMDDSLTFDNEDANLIFKVEDDNLENSPLKKQKLNSGQSSSFTKKMPKKRYQNMPNGARRIVTDRKDIDERLWPGAISFVDGKYMIPKACENCKEVRQFCNRNLPCASCARKGKDCHRLPGTQVAKPYLRRGPNRILNDASYIDNTDGADDPDTVYLQMAGVLESPLLQPRSRGRPPKSGVWIKKEVSNRAKRERDIKDVPMINLIDPQEGKPSGIRKPEVWCESRQELCESLPYYRSYQSGCYGHDGLIHGYLLDGFAAPRDYIDGKVVISHSGGKSAADEDGQRRLLTNQTPEDKVIKYLLANMKNQLPLVLIMGTQCSASPSKLPHRYCVMDWFKVTAGWAERDPRSRYTRWKFRFEKLDSTVDGWWAATPSTEHDSPAEMVKASCSFCKTESPHVYEEGWMCLKPECVRFWTLNGKDAPADVKYTNNFLRCRTPWPTEFLTPPSPLGPPLNFNRDVFFDGGDVSRIFWKGMCCPKCGRLNCREFWAGWRCLSCDFKFDPPRTIFDAARLADPHRPVFTGPAIPANICHDDITYQRYVKDGMTVIQYQLGDCGTVTHILANQKSNARPRDADWLFREYQSAEMPFKRFTLGNHKAQGRLLTQQFTFNCGAPYKFIVDVESYPFDKSPPVVSRALEVIHDRVNLIHPETQFNEVLNVGYFEKQKMDYHDDGEEGLGETVASISLGAPARMRFRVKARYAKERHCWTTRPVTPPPQSHLNEFHVKEEPKNDEVLELGDEDEDEDPERNEEVIGGQQPLSPPGKGPKKLSKGRVKLDLCLSHGDVMVMKGRDIQKYWEHSVIPQGLFRIAATARFIAENHPGVLNEIKSETAARAEAERLANKQEVEEKQTPIESIPKANLAEEHTVDQNRQPPETPKTLSKSSKELSPNSTPNYSMPLTTNGNQYEIPGLLNSGNTTTSNLGYNNSPYPNEPEMITANFGPVSHGSTNITRNPLYDSALMLPSPSSNIAVPLTQGLPRFATANILHPINQPISLSHNLLLPLPTSQSFVASPQQILETHFSNQQETVLPSLGEAFVFDKPPFRPTEHSRIPSFQTIPTDTSSNHLTDRSYQQELMHTFHSNNQTYPQTRLSPPNPGRISEVEHLNSEQFMSNMPNILATPQIGYRIPGLTTLWPEMGFPDRQNSEDSKTGKI